LPDLRSRSIVHPGAGNGLDTVTWGEKSGQIQHTLNTSQMPTHSHTHNISAKEEANTDDPNGNFIAGSGELRFGTSSDVSLNGTPTGNTGGNLPFSIRNPYIGIYTCIALVGLYPSRN
jgi:microcystin-dependent protein